MISLTAFSQYKLGGVQNFYYNILSHAPADKFAIKWIFEDVNDADPKLQGLYGIGEEVIFPINIKPHETTYEMARRLQRLIPAKKGILLANFWHDLATLHICKRTSSTIFFICHDEGYVPLAKNFEFLIDVFIAHNYQFYEEMRRQMPERKEDIYFIPFGVKLSSLFRIHQPDQPLKIVIAARLHVSKGVYDIPEIDELIRQKGLTVQWTIIGQGPEKRKLEEILLPRGNFSFHSPAKNEEVIALMAQQDIFILPSRLDGLPVALLESMSVGCVPVISRFNEGIGRVVTPDIGSVLPQGDIAQFADEIIRLSGDRGELMKRSRKARQEVIENYNIEIQAKKYFDLFERFEALKRPVRRVFRRYGGWLDHPFCPPFLRAVLRRLKLKTTS